MDFSKNKSANIDIVKHGPVQLNEKPVSVTDKIKLLGVYIESSNRNTTQISERQQKATDTIHNLKRIGIFSMQMKPSTKAFIYKCYVRPMLLYGLDVITLSQTEQNEIVIADTSMIKHMLRLGSRSSHTQLLYALDIKAIEKVITKMKITLILRLMKNKVTLKLRIYRLPHINNYNAAKNDLIGEISNYFREDLVDEPFDICLFDKKLRRRIEFIDFQHSILSKDTTVKKLKDTLEMTDGKHMTEANFY